MFLNGISRRLSKTGVLKFAVDIESKGIVLPKGVLGYIFEPMNF